MLLPSFESSAATSPHRPPPYLPASTTSLPPSLSASTAPHNDPSDPTHNNHQTRDPNPDAPEPASNLNKPTTTTPSATSSEELNVDDQIPRDGMIFDSEEEVRAFYNKYGHEVGFGVRQSSTLTRGKLKYFAPGCSKGGKYTPKEGSSKLKLSSKTGCEAKNFVSVRSTGRCVISQVNLDHNHGLSPTKSRFQRSHKTLDSYSKRRLELNDCAGIPMNKNFHSLVVEARGYENLQFDERDCRNYIAKVRQLRLGVGDAEALRNYFLRMQRRNSNFFYVIDMDDDGRLRNVFWADARSRAAYDSFGDVISFDSTYLTNRYNMSFSPFVGVNHHGQSILFGCGLLSREDIETYVWLFKSWLECMRGRAPRAIITDQCQSIKAAVAQVFPQSHHRFCLWHIMKKVPEKLGALARYKEIKKSLKIIVYDSMESFNFDKDWNEMIEKYGLQKNEWLGQFFIDRGRWVPIYVKEIFWAGMSTTQRSESMNAFFDEYVNSKTSLRQFVEQYDSALKSKVEKENKADFASSNSSYQLITSRSFEKQLQETYTNAIFKLFQDELCGMIYCNLSLHKVDGPISIYHVNDVVEGKDGHHRKRFVYIVQYDDVKCDVKCSCRYFEFKGILCRHIAKILIEKDVKEIPSCYILNRWRKNIRHSHYYVQNCYDDWETSEQAIQIDKLSANFFEAAYMVDSKQKYEFLMKWVNEAKEKLRDTLSWDDSSQASCVGHATKPSAKLLPPLQVRSKGRPPSKRKESKIEKIMKTTRKKKKVNSSVDNLQETNGANCYSTQPTCFSPLQDFDLNH
ncbi:hypothetical protein OROGR_009180 [Orobanche gracilis]